MKNYLKFFLRIYRKRRKLSSKKTAFYRLEHMQRPSERGLAPLVEGIELGDKAAFGVGNMLSFVNELPLFFFVDFGRFRFADALV